MEPASTYVEVAGVRYHVRRMGDGPPVLLLHGFPETGESYARNWSALVAAGRTVLVPDLKGYGQTDKPRPGTVKGDYRVRSLSLELGELIEALGHDSMDVVGHDWGGILLSAMMRTCRHRIRKAVLLNAPFRRFLPWRPRHVYFFNLPELPERRFWRKPIEFVTQIIRYWSVRPEVFSAEDIRCMTRALQQDGSISCAFAYYRGLRKDLPFMARAILGGLGENEAPETLIIWGTGDPVLPTSVGRMAHKDLPGSRLELIEGAGHFVHREAADRVNPLLAAFLSAAS